MKLQGRVLYFARVGKSLVKWLLSEAFRGLVEKMRTPVPLDINRPFKRQKYAFLDKRIVYQSFGSAPLTFSNFSSGESSVYRHVSASRLRNVYCLLLSDKMSRRKKLYYQLCLRQIVHSNGKITLSLLEQFL